MSSSFLIDSGILPTKDGITAVLFKTPEKTMHHTSEEGYLLHCAKLEKYGNEI